MHKILPVLVLAASPASAEFVEGTLFPMLDSDGTELSFDAPVETANGKRWNNVTLRIDDGGVRLDWLEETVSGDTTTLTFSDTGTLFGVQAGDEVIIATMRLTDAIWTIQEDSDGLAHEASADAIMFNFSEQNIDADGYLSLSDLTTAVDIEYGENYVVQSVGTVGQLEFALRDMEAAGDEVTVTLSDMQVRQDSDVDADLFERLQNAEEEFESVEDVQAALSGVSSSSFQVADISVVYGSVESEVTAAEFVSRNLQGRSDIDFNGDMLDVVFEGTTEALAGSIASLPLNGSFEASDYDVALSLGMARADIPQFVEDIEAGGPEALSAFDLRYEVGVGETKVNGTFDDDDVTGSVDFVSGVATDVIAIEDGRLSFEVLTDGFDGTFALSMLGDEAFSASLDKLDMVFAMPLVPSKSEEPDELAFVFKALEAVVSDAVWALFDAEGTIPRDPVSINVDIAGWGELLAPLDEGSDFNEVFRTDGVRINAFDLSGGGAEVTASGETLLDMSTGIPTGDGAFSVSLKGVTDLIGRLATLGLVPAEANLGLRGVLGAFARPVGEDHYVSEIELLPDGRILTNGVPLPLGR